MNYTKSSVTTSRTRLATSGSCLQPLLRHPITERELQRKPHPLHLNKGGESQMHLLQIASLLLGVLPLKENGRKFPFHPPQSLARL